MRPLITLTLLSLAGCGGDGGARSHSEPLDCSDGQVPIYSSRFTPAAGASGVATPADAEAGKTSSDPAATGEAASATTGSSDTTAMTVTCGKANCPSGKVAVDVPPMEPSGSGSGGLSGTPSTSEGKASPSGTPTPPSDSSPPSSGTPTPSPADMIVCTDPPPVCPTGQSPQFTVKNTWECTDCALVVTYGGTYGNYRRCVDAPHLNCPDGQVPTWVFEDEQWECKPECDNGAYDQHMIGDTLVCVPC